MRIITGTAKGRKLISPNGYDVTRPTLSRVKHSIFNIIQNKLNGDSIVLDLFSGTGSLGLEACSRGAKLTYLCDKDSDTFTYLRKNIENLGFKEISIAIKGDFYENIKRLSEREKFDIIFVDPPYGMGYISKSINAIDQFDILKEDGIIVTKILTSEEKFVESERISLFDHRKYGKTTVCFYEYKENHK